jgi:alkyl hydroperoxide reductase subunit AhpC
VQIPSYEEDHSEFDRFDTQVLGISIDSPYTNKGWANSLGGISYPLLSDFWPHGMVALKYNVLRQEGMTERALFIIDKEGIVRYVDVHDIGDQPKNSVLLEELAKVAG